MKRYLLAAFAVLVFAGSALAASNPFSDVPQTHWAYDAVASLAARGVIVGYPDGLLKGARPATRYELAASVSRALAVIDMERASKADVEMLKRLVVEFRDELTALGVKVDSLDSRVAVFERDLSGWSFSGELRFDAKFSDSTSGAHGEAYPLRGKNEFDLDRYRLNIHKRINDTTSFTTRLTSGFGDSSAMWELYYITTKLGKHTSLKVGRDWLDFEDELGLYVDDDAYFGDALINQIRWTREWSRSTLDIVVGRLNDSTGLPTGYGFDFSGDFIDGTQPEDFEQILIAVLYNYQFSEKFRAGLMFYGQHSDEDEKTYPNGVELDACINTYAGYAAYEFQPGLELKGVYYHQVLSEYQCDIKQMLHNGLDAPFKRRAEHWRLILDVDQDVLKFTSLWAEYGRMDNNFHRLGSPAPTGDFGADLLANAPYNCETTRFFGIRVDQHWNDTWRTYAKYWKFDYDTEGWDDASLWAVGVGYRLNPAIEFELGYEKVDYGKSWQGAPGTDTTDGIVRLRTFVTF